MIDNIVVCCS